MGQTALIVRVPEAESQVRELRERFDPSASVGVPAHITVLFPFMAAEHLSHSVRAEVSGILAKHRSFSFQLRSVGRFPATAYLTPEPGEPFVALTNSLVRRFPEFRPYGGAYSSVLPHLTVADGNPANASIAEGELEELLKLHGPIQSTCNRVTLLENFGERWEEIHAFELRQEEG
jgi:2'-5' RNA ligase